jgi:hypothetical protein
MMLGQERFENGCDLSGGHWLEVVFLKRRAQETEKRLCESFPLGIICFDKTADNRGFDSATGMKIRIWIANRSKVIRAAFIPRADQATQELDLTAKELGMVVLIRTA